MQLSLTLNTWNTLEATLKRSNTKFLKLLAVLILNPLQAHVELKKKGRREEEKLCRGRKRYRETEDGGRGREAVTELKCYMYFFILLCKCSV